MIIWDVPHLFRILPVINSVEWTVVFFMKTMLRLNHEVLQKALLSWGCCQSLMVSIIVEWKKFGTSRAHPWAGPPTKSRMSIGGSGGEGQFHSNPSRMSPYIAAFILPSGSNWWIAEDGCPLWMLLLSAQTTSGALSSVAIWLVPSASPVSEVSRQFLNRISYSWTRGRSVSGKGKHLRSILSFMAVNRKPERTGAFPGCN